MNQKPKKIENLKEKLKIEFSPKIIASNCSLQPIYDMILTILRTTEFWEDLERAVDKSISEIEKKVLEYVIETNFKSFEITNGQQKEQQNANKPIQSKPTKVCFKKSVLQKNDFDTKSTISRNDKKQQISMKQLPNFEHGKLKIPKFEPKLTGHHERVNEVKPDIQNVSMTSNISITNELLNNEAFQAKIAQMVLNQLGTETKQGSKSQSEENLAIKSRNALVAKHRGDFKKHEPEANMSFQDGQWIKITSLFQQPLVSSDFGEVNRNKKPSEDHKSSDSNFHNLANRYSKKNKPGTEDMRNFKLIENAFNAKISDDEKPRSNSISDNPSNESCMSEGQEKKLEMMRKNLVRRESLTKGAGLAFSFGKAPPKNNNLPTNLSYNQQISNFEESSFQGK